MKRYDGASAELAAVDGRKRLNMDKVMTAVCFVLLLIIVVINFRTQGIMGERELDIRSLRDYARKAQSKIKGGKKV